MTVDSVRTMGLDLVSRLKKLPLTVTLVAGTAVLVVLALAALEFSHTSYAVLFDGLSPARGGKVIDALQKEGIPYRLSADGNVISVPAADLGKARLRLGVEGEPQTDGSASWKALESASVTTSQAATSALQLQATETSLQSSITALSGAARVQVLLALPKDTPFLADQAHPKASVILTGAPQADPALGVAVAQIVAGAVPGLDVARVVVATNGGTILYPAGNAGDVARQLAVVGRIEAAQEAKIRSLLAPILGPGNSRVSVSADIDFATKAVQSVSYGPKSIETADDDQSRTQYGKATGPIGIPGALSNQPPGPTTAPVNAPAAPQAATGQPASASHHQQKTFAVDKTSTTERPASWSVNKINASVVVNRAALRGLTTDELKAMISSTIAVPVGEIDVTSSDFVSGSLALAGSPVAQISRIAQAGLLLIAAFGFLLGLVRPFTGWLRTLSVDAPSAPASARFSSVRNAPNVGFTSVRKAPADAAAGPIQENLSAVNLRHIAGQVAEFSLEKPEMMASVLQRWLAGDSPDLQPEDAG